MINGCIYFYGYSIIENIMKMIYDKIGIVNVNIYRNRREYNVSNISKYKYD